eukprot:TRINITY_DN33545_c0_g1_i1.p1 TRINITY_DN33545_c0_g1~~TRINITY_DN33545_c0_g1_i1.p1  ORF type:complete len:370 (+),score=51.13 TRINITY_DN33545_c0_g1_i1:39-1148(+)
MALDFLRAVVIMGLPSQIDCFASHSDHSCDDVPYPQSVQQLAMLQIPKLSARLDSARQPDLRPPSREEIAKGYNCREALDEWRTGWSVEKIKWCCVNRNVACQTLESGVEHPTTPQPPPNVQGNMEVSELAFALIVDVIIEVDTSNSLDAGTTTGASMAFQVGPDWTEELDLCRTSERGEVIVRNVRLPSWPQKVRITALGNDSWEYSAINLYHTSDLNKTVKLTVLNETQVVGTDGDDIRTDSRASDGNDKDRNESSWHWYIVPALLDSQKAKPTCVTRDDARFKPPRLYGVSPAGTHCVFGVDDADEGSHCIYDNGDYGSFGWCYTSKDRATWGPCSGACPLYGQYEVLGTRLDEALRRIKKMSYAA